MREQGGTRREVGGCNPCVKKRRKRKEEDSTRENEGKDERGENKEGWE